MRFHTVVAIVCLTLTTVTIAATQVRDTRGPSVTMPAGSGVVRGVVMTDAAEPQPVRRATVRLLGTAVVPRLVGTDDLGRFVFDALPADRYTLSVSKVGFVQAFHGAPPGIGPGVPLAVADGQAIDVSMALLPGAAITGVVTDARGQPAADVPVAAVDTRSRAGTTPTPARSVTDDRGVYRIFGLPPGEYLVSALPQLTPASSFRGGQSNAVVAATSADVQWARSAVAGTVGRPPSASGSFAPPVAYAPVFYPGTTDVAGAVTVDVASGAERANVDLPLRIVNLARLAGRLMDGQGQPLASAMVSLVPKRGGQPTPVDALVGSGALALPRATVSASTFEFSGVAPGQYTLIARTGSGQRGAAPAEAAAPTLWSVSDIFVDGLDREGLELRLLPGAVVSGRVVAGYAGTGAAGAANPTLSFVAMNPIPGVASTYRATTQSDGTFVVRSVAPGSYLVRADAAADRGPLLRSAALNGRDLVDVPLVVENDGAEVSGVVVTFTDRLGAVTGRLLDSADRPVTRYSIVVFTPDPSLWLPNARRVRVGRPATDGSFVVDGLPAGEYAVVAVDDAENVERYDANFLAPLLASAVRLTVTEGQSTRQDFRVASGQRQSP